MCELKKSSFNALGPTLVFMQYLEHLMLPEYFLGIKNERERNAYCRKSIFDDMMSIKINV